MTQATRKLRRTKPATALEVKAMREPGRYTVGGNLLLVVQKTGSRSWIGRVAGPDKKYHDIGLGKYPEVSLAEARNAVEAMRKQSRAGIDPLQAKNEKPLAIPTFKEASIAWHEERAPQFRNAKHAAQWINTLRDYAFTALGSKPVDQISVPDVVRTMKPIWTTKQETARRVLQRIVAVSKWSVSMGYRQYSIDADAVRMGLPEPSKSVRHHPAIEYHAAPAFMKALKAKQASVSRMALQFLMLTGARSGEVRGALWDEIGFATVGREGEIQMETWTISADRMKAGREHVIPLTPSMLAILAEMRTLENKSGLIFPSPRNKPLSDVALSKSLKQLAPGKTVHGCRSTFADWQSELTSFDGNLREAALAHAIKDKTEAAYRRGNLLQKRHELMLAWDSYLNGKSANVENLGEFKARKKLTG